MSWQQVINHKSARRSVSYLGSDAILMVAYLISCFAFEGSVLIACEISYCLLMQYVIG